MPPDPSTPSLRASDADREAAVERLRTAAMEGRLDTTELDDRLTAAYAARWCTELEQLTADVTPAPPSPSRLNPPVFVQPASRTNGFAIASLVTSLVWMWWLGSVLGIVFGHVALRQIARSGGQQTGRGLAIAGLTIGYLATAFLLAVLVALTL